MPRSPASVCRRSSAAPMVSGLPWVITAARLISADCFVDPALELIRDLRLVAMNEVKEELAVPFRAGQPGVYDAGDLCLPARRRLGGLAQHAPPDPGIADDAPRGLGPACLELRLHEHERLPARRREPKHRRQGLPKADEGHVARDELRRKGKP